MNAAYANSWPQTQSYDNFEWLFGVNQLHFGRVFAPFNRHGCNMDSIVSLSVSCSRNSWYLRAIRRRRKPRNSDSSQSRNASFLGCTRYKPHRLPSKRKNNMPTYWTSSTKFRRNINCIWSRTFHQTNARVYTCEDVMVYRISLLIVPYPT